MPDTVASASTARTSWPRPAPTHRSRASWVRRWVRTMRKVEATTTTAATSARPAKTDTPVSTASTVPEASRASPARCSAEVRMASGAPSAAPILASVSTSDDVTSTWSSVPPSVATACGSATRLLTGSVGNATMPVTTTWRGADRKSTTSRAPGRTPVRSAVAVPTATSSSAAESRPPAPRPAAGSVARPSGRTRAATSRSRRGRGPNRSPSTPRPSR